MWVLHWYKQGDGATIVERFINVGTDTVTVISDVLTSPVIISEKQNVNYVESEPLEEPVISKEDVISTVLIEPDKILQTEIILEKCQ